MSGHTKGPWTIVDDSGNIYGQRRFICSANGSNTKASMLDEVHNAENWANAHLITAAPDMYEALKRILAAHESKKNIVFAIGLRSVGIRQQAYLCNHFASKARAAIAKAEGK